MSKRASLAFVEELAKLIEHFRAEWELTYCEAIGCLEMVKFDVLQELSDEDESEED